MAVEGEIEGILYAEILGVFERLDNLLVETGRALPSEVEARLGALLDLDVEWRQWWMASGETYS